MKNSWFVAIFFTLIFSTLASAKSESCSNKMTFEFSSTREVTDFIRPNPRFSGWKANLKDQKDIPKGLCEITISLDQKFNITLSLTSSQDENNYTGFPNNANGFASMSFDGKWISMVVYVEDKTINIGSSDETSGEYTIVIVRDPTKEEREQESKENPRIE